MTDSEIAKMFREAKDKREQITILAQMNCTSEDWIRIILVKRCGVDGRSLPRKKKGGYKPKKNAPTADLIADVDPDEKPAADAVEVTPSAPSEESAIAPASAKRGTVLLGVINDLTDMVEKLNDKRNELARTIADAEAQIKEIDVALIHLSTASQACARG
jgi:hypothetical protein